MRWALVALVVVALGGAGLLFWSDARDAAETGRDAPREEERELAEPELQVPDDDGDDGGRRGEPGRDRLEQGRGGSDSEIDDPADAPDDDVAGDEGDETPLPAVFDNLAGRRVALLPASIDADDADAVVRIGGLRVPCAALGDAELLDAELREVRAIEALLRRARARVVLLEPAQLAGTNACVDDRVALLERAQLGIVVRATSGRPRVLAGRATAATSGASRRATAAFAAELAARLGLRAPATADAAATRLLARAGAIDLDGGAAIALVELPPAANDAARDDRALDVATALAVTASRAGAS